MSVEQNLVVVVAKAAPLLAGYRTLGAITTVREQGRKSRRTGAESVGFEQVLKKVLWRLVTEGRRRGLPGGASAAIADATRPAASHHPLAISARCPPCGSRNEEKVVPTLSPFFHSSANGTVFAPTASVCCAALFFLASDPRI